MYLKEVILYIEDDQKNEVIIALCDSASPFS